MGRRNDEQMPECRWAAGMTMGRQDEVILCWDDVHEGKGRSS